MHRAAHWKERSDEGLMTQPHASRFDLPPSLPVRTEPLLDESLGSFSLANKTPAKPTDGGSAAPEVSHPTELLCRNPVEAGHDESPTTSSNAERLT
tara:strand:- start:230 stop:517 length:288 start_codon:yes stop_codon:yes gene_type:complete